MSRIVNNIKRRLTRYEQATGNNLAFNVLGGVAVGLGVAAGIAGLERNSAEAIFLSASLMIGGAAVANATYDHEMIEPDANRSLNETNTPDIID